MKKKHRKILCIWVLAIIFVLMTASLLMPKKDFSENENRYLAEFPKLTFASIKDHSFMSDLEDYVSDHFAFRDLFMTIRYDYERITGRDQINGVYVCKDGYLIKEYEQPSHASRIVAAIGRLSKASGAADFHVMLVPTAVNIYSNLLPSTALNADQAAELKALNEAVLERCPEADIIDVTEVLTNYKNREELYYKLDHHWTTDGAYYAYTEYCRHVGIEPYSKEDFQIERVSDNFKGSFYSDVNNIAITPDQIKIYRSNRLKLTVEYKDRKLTTDSLYEESYLDKKDKYSYFLNNQNSFIEISNENATSDKVLVLVKDSYANCFVPFLAEHYSKIYVFDTRYYRSKVSEFISEHEEITDVLFLYNMYTIDTDTGIAGIN